LVINSIATDHASDAPLIALAQKYFKKFDAMATDPSPT
jgi:hypothetical protein